MDKSLVQHLRVAVLFISEQMIFQLQWILVNRD